MRRVFYCCATCFGLTPEGLFVRVALQYRYNAIVCWRTTCLCPDYCPQYGWRHVGSSSRSKLARRPVCVTLSMSLTRNLFSLCPGQASPLPRRGIDTPTRSETDDGAALLYVYIASCPNQLLHRRSRLAECCIRAESGQFGSALGTIECCATVYAPPDRRRLAPLHYPLLALAAKGVELRPVTGATRAIPRRSQGVRLGRSPPRRGPSGASRSDGLQPQSLRPWSTITTAQSGLASPSRCQSS
jgi:hypothetical protein